MGSMPRGVDKVFCHLPWTHLCAHLDGVYARCCQDTTASTQAVYRGERPGRLDLPEGALGVSPGSAFAADHPDRVLSIAEAFNSPELRATRLSMLAGEPLTACSDCYERERIAGDSYRLQMLRQDRSAPSIVECRSRTAADGSVDGFPVSLDLRLGNHCNLRCVMCGVPTSSSIVRDDPRTWLTTALDPFTRDEQFWETVRNNLSYVRYIYFAGGEPLLIPAHRRLLRLMIEEDAAAHIELTYASNLTVLPSEILDMWRQFARVSVEASCDGVGAVFEAIRRGARWPDFERHAELLRDLVDLSIHVSPQRDNVLYLPEIVAWALERKLPIHLSNIVRLPEYLSIRNLPDDVKREARERLERLLAGLARTGQPYVARDVQGILDYLMSPPSVPLPPVPSAQTRLADREGN